MGSTGNGKLEPPNYEVKLLMQPDLVLDWEGKLNDSVVSEFKIKPDAIKMAIEFIDTPEQAIYNNDWNLRIRKSDGDKKFGLTYKKRYPITLTSKTDPAANIEVEVTKARDDGFDGSFESQVEVGYTKQTLSISYNAKASDKGYDGMDLPHAKDSRKMLEDKAPHQFISGSVSSQAAGSDGPFGNLVVYGPVEAKRYVGSWAKVPKLYIEVWPIRTSNKDPTLKPTVEASFKVNDVTEAMDGLRDLGVLLKEKGWLLAEDSLKTSMIMKNYVGGSGKP